MGDRMRENATRALWEAFPRQHVGTARRTYDDLLEIDKDVWRRMTTAVLDACHFDELVTALEALLDETVDALLIFGDGPPGDKLDDKQVIRRARAVLKKVEASDG